MRVLHQLAGLAVSIVGLFTIACSSGPAASEDKAQSCSDSEDCDDGEPCNGEEQCIENQCTTGKATECPSGQACSSASGLCTSQCDADGDGHDAESCGGEDCDDSDPFRFPGNAERCFGEDGDVDLEAQLRDEDCDPSTLGEDRDGDGYYSGQCGNRDRAGLLIMGADCDDLNDLKRPGFQEICDGQDNDCNGRLDYPGEDNDGDGYADCADLEDTALFDCDDEAPHVNPGIEEDVCDYVDANCDGYVEDADEDGYFSVEALCTLGSFGALSDCDDTRSSTNSDPDTLEVCNGIDDDCSGVVDDHGALASCGVLRFSGAPACAGTSGCEVVCDEYHANCDGNPDNSCEADLRVNTDNCGACGHACPSGCAEGACLPTVTVAAAFRNTCSLDARGTVRCWGSGQFGTTGTGSFVQPGLTAPAEVVGLQEAAVALEMSYSRSACALLKDGTVWCWGGDSNGQLGDGQLVDQPSPVQVQGLTGAVVQLALGSSHSCARYSSGTMACWGSDSAGQIGDGANGNANKLSPVTVSGLTGVIDLAAGFQQTCALRSSGDVYCWGSTSWGVLGNGVTESGKVESPTKVQGLRGKAIAIEAVAHTTCAVLEDKTAQCWGRNSQGELGIGSALPAASGVPLDVQGVDDIAELSVGMDSVCVRLESGEVMCWGSNAHGQVGDVTGDATVHYAPNLVPLPLAAHALSSKGMHACAILADERIQCWGQNSFGQLGNGLPLVDAVFEPQSVSGARNAAQGISAGYQVGCVVLDSGEVQCWGNDESGGLGDGADANEEEPSPVKLSTSARFLQVSVGRRFSCGVDRQGAVLCWGYDWGRGALGAGQGISTSEVPLNVQGLDEPAVAVSAGWMHGCALLQSGNVSCWGDDSNGQVGDGNDGQTYEFAAVPVVGLPQPARSISLGSSLSCALLQNGEVFCWGSNSSGQVGQDSSLVPYAPAPVLVELPGVARAVGAGTYHACAVLEGGEVHCWGSAGDADGAPVAVGNMPAGVVSVTASSSTCVRTDGGAVYCWGANSSAGLGVSSGNQATPTSPVPLPGPAWDVAIGFDHACARLSNGEAWCWGRDFDGQLGDGPGSNSTYLPARVDPWAPPGE